MIFDTNPSFLGHLIRSSAFVAAGQHNALYRAARSGDIVKLATGVYLPRAVWALLDADARYLARVHAASGVLPADRVHSHLTAAALWRLPKIGSWPAKSHVTRSPSMSGSVRAHHAVHGASLDSNTDVIDGLRVTSLARTVVDVARTTPMSVAVAMADRAVSPAPWNARSVHAQRTTLENLRETADAIESPRGSRACALALDRVDGASGSPGESVSRVAIHVLGFPAPILQKRFDDHLGSMFVDFWWPEFNLIGEFDGHGKYLNQDMLAGMSTAEAVIAEKDRENRLRALGPMVTRWDWAVARSLPLLDAQLRAAGFRAAR